jgi:PTH2 family peptidyl-tRNA hydrolase
MAVIAATGLLGGITAGYFLHGYFHPKSDAKPIDTSEAGSVVMVLAVRKDLGMRNGKMAAQFGHGGLGLFLKTAKHHPEIAERWATGDIPKRFFYLQSEDDMELLNHRAEQFNYCRSVIVDAGRTQIAAGSATVLAVGPVPLSNLNALTEGLKPVP